VSHAWIDVPAAKDEHGRIRHTRGVTTAPGLYVLGQTWQHTRGSALLGWVGADAAFLTGQISAQHAQSLRPSRASTAREAVATD
jgi:putative flavoprotein involved in K+ transport